MGSIVYRVRGRGVITVTLGGHPANLAAGHCMVIYPSEKKCSIINIYPPHVTFIYSEQGEVIRIKDSELQNIHKRIGNDLFLCDRKFHLLEKQPVMKTHAIKKPAKKEKLKPAKNINRASKPKHQGSLF